MFRNKREELEEAKLANCSICNENKRIVHIRLDGEAYAGDIIVVATMDCGHINIYKLDWLHKKSFSKDDIIKIKEKSILKEGEKTVNKESK